MARRNPPLSPAYRTPRSAIAFGGLLLGLTVLYLFVVFVYGNGWTDLLSALLGVGMLVL